VPRLGRFPIAPLGLAHPKGELGGVGEGPAEAGTAIRLFADRSQQCAAQLAAGAALGAVGVAGLAAAAVVVSPLALAATPVVAVAAVATSRVGRRQARTIAVELERVLDMAERGVDPVGVLDGVRRIARRNPARRPLR
jgi:hypothetical protein